MRPPWVGLAAAIIGQTALARQPLARQAPGTVHETSCTKAAVFFEHRAQRRVRQGDDAMVVDTRHVLRSDHGVDDGLFGCFHRGANRGSRESFGSISNRPRGRAALRRNWRWKCDEMSTEPLPEMLPLRPRPRVTRRARRFSWCASSGASVATTTMMEPCSASPQGMKGVGFRRGGFRARPELRDTQIVASAVIALHEHPDHVAAVFAFRRRDELPIPPL